MPKRRIQESDESAAEEDNYGSGSDYEAPVAPKSAKKSKKDAKTVKPKGKSGPTLKKPSTPDWNQKGWTTERLDGKYASKSIERWCLLPPYDTRIQEKYWKEYYMERSALDEINTKGSSAAEKIESEELGQDTFTIMRAAASSVAANLYGAPCLSESERKQIARTLRGSLYFIDLWGNDEEGGGDNPRTVNAKTRLYSPFGLGSSIELVYNFHWRQFRAGERFSDLVVSSRHISDCNSKNPAQCTTVITDKWGRGKPAELSVKVFDMNNSKIKGTTAKNIEHFAEDLFGVPGWLSPLKIFNLLCSAGTVLHYKEQNRSTVQKTGPEKFKFFQGESDGQDLRKEETELLLSLEKELKGKDEKVCMPQRLLLLARQDWESGVPKATA